MRMLPTVAELGLTSLTINYRNDEGLPANPDGYHRFGQTEWADLEGAAKYALAHGAEGLRVLALPEVGALRSDDMGPVEEVLIGSDVYQLLIAEHLPAGTKFDITLSGLSEPTFGDQLSEATEWVRPEYAALAGLAVLMTSLLVFGVWKTSRPAEEEGAGD